MRLLMSVCDAEDHHVIYQIEHLQVPERYKNQVPYSVVECAIDCAAIATGFIMVPTLGQYTYTDYNALRDLLHCKIYVHGGGRE